MDNILENAIIYLIRQERFYAEMLHGMTKTFTTELETMGVSIDTKGVHLFINPYFLNHLSVPEQAEVLKHECEHPFRGHFERERTLAPELYAEKKDVSILDRYKNMTTAYMLNVAEDMAINETLPNLPKKWNLFDKEGKVICDEAGKPVECAPCLVDDLVAQFPNEVVQRNQAMEYYYSFIKEKKEAGHFNGKNKDGRIMLPMDLHDMLQDAMKDIDPQFAKAIFQKLANEAKERTPGRLPGHLEVLIDKLNRSTHDWKKDFRMFKAHCSTPEKKSTWKKRNRRYGLLYPGKKSKVKLHLVAAIDSSGSVNDKCLAQIMSELGRMKEVGVDITVIECDCTVNQIYSFEPTKVPKVKGRGGTAFAPVFNLVETKEFIKEYGEVDGLIYLTDGGNYDNPDIKQPAFPVLWALLPSCSSNYSWGRKTTIEVND